MHFTTRFNNLSACILPTEYTAIISLNSIDQFIFELVKLFFAVRTESSDTKTSYGFKGLISPDTEPASVGDTASRYGVTCTKTNAVSSQQ
jgi:hypothetical protein